MSLKRALICSTALIGSGLVDPAAAFAVSCPAYITDSSLAGVVCDFDSSSSVTVESGGELGGIHMDLYSPVSSFIANGGTITDTGGAEGIFINSSSLTNGISNTGTISSAGRAIQIGGSTIHGGITNGLTGNITSTGNDTFVITSASQISGGITNDGTISSSDVFATVVILNYSTVTDGLHNTGTIEATGDGSAILLRSSATISGGITNSGTISSDGNTGLTIMNTSLLNGDITNETGGIISGGINGISVQNASTINGSILNQTGATISGGDTGIRIYSSTTISGGLENYGTISGVNTGISVTSSAVISGGIANHGIISGDTKAIDISGSSYVSNIDLFGGSRVIGAVDAGNTDVNIIGDFTTEGSMNVNAFNITSGAVLTMANTITAASGVNNSGIVTLGTTTQTIAGDYVQHTGGLLKIDAQDVATYGQLAATGTADLSQSGAIDVNMLSGASFTAGDVLTNVISGGTLVAPSGSFEITDNSRLLNFEAAVNGGTTGVDLTAVDDASTSIYQSNAATGNRGGAGAARSLDTMIALNPGGDWQNVIGALNRLSSDQEITNAVNQTAPVLGGATNTALIGIMSTTSQIVEARQQARSGVSSGDGFETNRNFWLKTFGSWGDQGNQNGVIGYDSEAYGLIVGADKAITDKASLGAGVSYFNTELNSNNGVNRVRVNSYLGMVYGSYSLDGRTDVNAQIEAGYNSSDSTRNIDFGGLNRIAKGSYGGWNVHAGTGLGRIMSLGAQTTITPQLRVDYFSVGNQSYTESGAGALNLRVDSQTQDQLTPAAQVKVNHAITPALSVALNAGLGYDLLNERNTVSASFAGGGVFVTRGLAPSPWVTRSGAGLTWIQSDALDVTARYDREDRGSNYADQAVSLKLRMPF